MFRIAICVVALVSVFCTNEDGRVVQLLERLDTVEQLLHGYEKRLAEQAFQVDIQQKTINALNQTSQQLKEAVVPLGFTAFATEQREYDEGDTILFDEIRYNIGFNYNAATSIFTVPYAGLYFFSATLYTELDNHMSGDIIRTAAPIVQIWAPDTIQSDQATNMAVIECVPGDQIFVRCVVPGTLEGFADPIAVTTFSGVMIERL